MICFDVILVCSDRIWMAKDCADSHDNDGGDYDDDDDDYD